MEMDFWYDFTFIGVPGVGTSSSYVAINTDTDNVSASEEANVRSPFTSSPITVINTLRRRSNDRVEFTAKLVMESNPITPYKVVWQIIKFPVFCMIIQFWIHYQALVLFMKGIVYVPHPQGTETAASVVIAKIMEPFFAIRDYVNPKSKTA